MEQDQSKVLLVEGAGDEGVIKEILNEWNVPCPCIKACGSDAQVFQALKLYLSNPGQYKTIGVIVDADINPVGRLQRFVQVLNASKRFRLDENNPLTAEGLITDGVVVDAARVGLWVMPDNQSHGMLEDFLAVMADTAHPELMVESESAISNIESKGLQQYTPRHRPKAKIHTYLAWQKDPGSTLPQAIQKHYLDVSSENARPFVSWINRLFWEKQAN